MPHRSLPALPAARKVRDTEPARVSLYTQHGNRTPTDSEPLNSAITPLIALSLPDERSGAMFYY